MKHLKHWLKTMLKSKLNIEAVKYFLTASAIAFIALGVIRGEVNVVLRKSIRICLECIGIG